MEETSWSEEKTRPLMETWHPVSAGAGELARWQAVDGRHIAIIVEGEQLGVTLSWQPAVVLRYPTLHEAVLAARALLR